MYDFESAAASVAPLLGPDTVVITLQNGVEAVDIAGASCRPRARRRRRRLHLRGDRGARLIRHTAMDSLIFGELDGRARSGSPGSKQRA